MGRQLRLPLLLGLGVAVCAWAAGDEVVDLSDDLEPKPKLCADYHPACRRWQGLKMCTEYMYAKYMSEKCAGSCDAACRSLGEANSTSTVTEDPVMVQLVAEIKGAQAKFDGASDWAAKMQKSQNMGCPCPGRDFHPDKPGDAARREKVKDEGNATAADEEDGFAGLSVEQADSLVEHYIKKYAEGQSSWTDKNEAQLKRKEKDLDKAGRKANTALHDARGDFERMTTDPMFQDWFKDMCPCKGEEGYEDMMEQYFKVKGHGDKEKANWHHAILENHRKKKAKEAAIVESFGVSNKSYTN